jgi:hypothetical protein
MADISYGDQRTVESFLGMSGGWVGSFTNATFREFLYRCVGIDIYGDTYAFNGDSKAKRLRAFFEVATGEQVARFLEACHANWHHIRTDEVDEDAPDELLQIAARVRSSSPLNDVMAALDTDGDDVDLDRLASAIRDAVNSGAPVTALDRLHTFLVRLFRGLCDSHNIEYARDTTLDGLSGKYARFLHDEGLIRASMTEKIIRYNGRIFQDFNDVRNTFSDAHANDVLGEEEAEFIVENALRMIRFIRSLEARLESERERDSVDSLDFALTIDDDELPF